MSIRKTYKDKIGDGKFPNLYWVSYSNDYNYLHDGNFVDWIGDLVPSFKSKGKTIAKPFKTYGGARTFANGLHLGKHNGFNFIVNCVTIEDRLAGELYEKSRIFDPVNATIVFVEREDTGFTKEKMLEAGEDFA